MKPSLWPFQVWPFHMKATEQAWHTVNYAVQRGSSNSISLEMEILFVIIHMKAVE